LAAAVVIASIALPQLLASHRGATTSPGVAADRPVTLAATPSKALAGAADLQPNCAASPHVCGYPDVTNTGVPASAHLLSVPDKVSSGRGWKYDSRGWVEVYGNGAILSNLYIPYNLDVSASNVTIDNVEIVVTGNSFGISLRHARNVTIENSEIYSPYNSGPNRLQVGIKDIYADSSDTKVIGNNIWNTATGIALSEGLITDNYIHDLAYNSGDHVNGIASKAGDPAGLSIVHNTVFNPRGQTDAIQLSQDFGPQLNCLITNNLLAGGAYSLYGGASGLAIPVNIVITNNRFAGLYYPHGGYYGPTAYVASGSGDIWSGNFWDDTLQPIN
jgi:hypothetical protein